MPEYCAALTILLLMATVITRAIQLKREGIEAMQFGKLDKTDFLIPPFALFYFYLIFAQAFNWPTVSHPELAQSEIMAWVGVLFCLVGVLLLWWSLASFGKSFRVGIDTQHPDRLVTTGAFALTRNPIYVALASVLIGQFLIFPNWLLLVYLVAAVCLFHHQVRREEAYLKQHYGKEYLDYCLRVRRYL